MRLVASTKSNITMDKNGENVPHLEINEVVLIHCNITMYPFFPNKSFDQLLNISPKNFIFFKKFNAEF